MSGRGREAHTLERLTARQHAAVMTWPEHDAEVVAEVRSVCPHCAGRRGSCCVCHETRVLDWPDLVEASAWIWARRGCPCDACKVVGPQPHTYEDEPPISPVSPFARGFAQRDARRAQETRRVP